MTMQCTSPHPQVTITKKKDIMSGEMITRLYFAAHSPDLMDIFLKKDRVKGTDH